jgi:lipopolysaccharide exporter
MSESLKTRAVRGFQWTTISALVTSVLQIGYTSIMSRLLNPEDFGLIAIAQIIFSFVAYFARMGMGQALIQKEKLSDLEIRAVFTSSMLLGISTTGAIWLLAPYVTLVFDKVDPQVVGVTRGMAISFLVAGLSITSGSILTRQLRFKLLAAQEIGTYLVAYLGIGVTMGLYGYGVWSLVAAQVSQSVFAAIINYALTRHSLAPVFAWRYHRPFFSYGSKISLTSFVEFIGGVVSPFLIGRFFGDYLLGIYRQAHMILDLPMYKITYSIQSVTFPVFSLIQSDKERLTRAYVSAMVLMTAVLLPICFSVAVAAEEVILVMFGEKFREAIPILRILSIGMGFKYLTTFPGLVCDATARLNGKLVVQTSYVVLLGLAAYIFRNHGLLGFAYIVTIGETLRNFAYLAVTGQILKLSLKAHVEVYLPSLLVGIVTALAVHLITISLHYYNIPNLLSLICQMATGFIVLAATLFIWPSQHMKGIIVHQVFGIPFMRNRFGFLLGRTKWYADYISREV